MPRLFPHSSVIHFLVTWTCCTHVTVRKSLFWSFYLSVSSKFSQASDLICSLWSARIRSSTRAASPEGKSVLKFSKYNRGGLENVVSNDGWGQLKSNKNCVKSAILVLLFCNAKVFILSTVCYDPMVKDGGTHLLFAALLLGYPAVSL